MLCQLPSDKPLAEALRETVREIGRRLEREASHAEAVRLMTAAYIVAGLRVKKADLASIFRGVGLMQESTAFDEAMEEGERRGEIRGRIASLRSQGRKRFGDPDASAEAELASIKDLDHLDRLSDAILSATSWQDLLATP